jgi:predicted nucleic acid-binding protein
MVLYLDSSAIVKLVVREVESAALRRFLRRHASRVSSALARVEVVRAVREQGPQAQTRALAVLARIRLLKVDDDILSIAALLDPGVLRSLDAIHLASAGAFGGELAGVVTYDGRMRDAAQLIGYPTFEPR